MIRHIDSGCRSAAVCLGDMALGGALLIAALLLALATAVAVLLLIATTLSLLGVSTARSFVGLIGLVDLETGTGSVSGGGGYILPATTFAQRALDPGFLLTAVIALLFLWGVLSPRTQPWSVLYRRAVQPHLAPPTELEDPRPPRFAQGVGLFVLALGIVLHLFGVPWALPIAAAAAFLAAFLNAAFGVCLGCQIYLLLLRGGIIRRATASS